MKTNPTTTSSRPKPLRTCLGCRQKKARNELLRVVRADDGLVRPDPEGTAPGRGAYICRNQSCLEKAMKSRGFSRSFRTGVSEQDLEQLIRFIAEEKAEQP